MSTPKRGRHPYRRWGAITFFVLAFCIHVRVFRVQAGGNLHAQMRAHRQQSLLKPISVSPRATVSAPQSDVDAPVIQSQQVEIMTLPDAVGTPGQVPRRLDDKRPQEQLTIDIFERPLTIGGELSTKLEYRQNFALGDEGKDELLRFDQRLELELFYPLTHDVDLFLEGKLHYRVDLDTEDGRRDATWGVERGETWILWHNIFHSPFSLQIGRQNFEEKREWWWDADLDAIRLHYDHGLLEAELSVAQELATDTSEDGRIDAVEEDVFRVLGRVAWAWAKKHALEGFLLFQYDHSKQQLEGDIVERDRRDPTDASLVWLGARALGRWRLNGLGRITYWVEAAGVLGHEVVVAFDTTDDGRRVVQAGGGLHQQVRGWAIDVGMSWRTLLPLRPTFTLGFALGSGDAAPDQGPDHAFRQTSLQNNNGRFSGVNRFHYYGELLRPELSNLQIWTLALGFPILRSSSVELVYHRYHQVEPNDFLRDVRLDVDPEGNERFIGQEWNLIVGVEAWKHWEIEWIGALFQAGSAYGDRSGELAYQAMIQVDFIF